MRLPFPRTPLTQIGGIVSAPNFLPKSGRISVFAFEIPPKIGRSGGGPQFCVCTAMASELLTSRGFRPLSLLGRGGFGEVRTAHTDVHRRRI